MMGAGTIRRIRSKERGMVMLGSDHTQTLRSHREHEELFPLAQTKSECLIGPRKSHDELV